MRGNTEVLATLLRPAMAAIMPRSDAQRIKRTDAAITEDGRASEYALRGSIHHAARWYLSGARSVANNIGEEIRIQADGRIERFDVRLKTAPVGADFVVRLRRNNISLVTVTIPDGAESAGVSVYEACNAGDILTIDITQIGSGTAGSSLSACATHREEGGS